MQWTKQIASHFGGSRNGMVISWPARIKDKGGLRSQFCHVIDIVPTNINEDFSQANNLADKYPDKLKELQDAFDVEAKKYNVYSLDSSFASRADPAIRPSLTRGRSEFVYFPGMIRIPEGSAPDFKKNPGPSPPR
jgi:arylsulfatase A-like enzyme